MKTLKNALMEIREELLYSDVLLQEFESSHKVQKTARHTLNINTDQKMNVLSEFYKFSLFMETNDQSKHSVGVAYLKDGLSFYTLKLWTFLDQKFYLLPRKEDPTKFLVMSREANHSVGHRNKYFWNVVGRASADSSQNVLEIHFDLLSKVVFMNLIPTSK